MDKETVEDGSSSSDDLAREQASVRRRSRLQMVRSQSAWTTTTGASVATSIQEPEDRTRGGVETETLVDRTCIMRKVWKWDLR